MKNVEIIKNYKEEHGIADNIILHSMKFWNKLGYKVKKGEHSDIIIAIYIKVKKTDKDTNDGSKTYYEYIKQKVRFFTEEQVELFQRKEVV